MADFPALPLWTDAYLADLHPRLSLEEHGCMILMMQFAWRSEGCRLEDDDKLIARMLSVTLNRWEQRLRPVMKKLWTVSDGFWTQKRLTKEHQFVANRTANLSERGRKGGEAKALKQQQTGLPGPPPKQATGLAPTPTPTPMVETSVSTPHTPTNGKDIEAAFDSWWEQVIRKVAKKKAKALYVAIVRRGEATTANLLDGIIRYNASETVARNFIVYPSTWLIQARWTDRPDPPPPAPPPSPTIQAIRNVT